jgi:hypothetical protein
MKKFKYSIGIFAFALIMCLSYYTSYRFMVSKDKNKTGTRSESQELKSVEMVEVHKITKNTKYVVEAYDIGTNEFKEEMIEVPSDFIGFTREQLDKALETYQKQPKEEDLAKGFIQISLVSFSKDLVILRKTYEGDYKYCLLEDNGYIIVYFKDKETIYEYTDILLSSLPEEMQTEIKQGKYVKDDHDLFSFLENYSS